jgi:flagellar biogenesis protein FliO
MGWHVGKMFVGVCVLLICAKSVVAQSTQPALQLSPGPYENQPITASGASPALTSPTSKPSLALASPGQLQIGRVMLALGIVIAMILTMRWAGRKFFPSAGVPRSSGSMKILTRLVISPKQQLLMIQVGKRIVVVGEAGGQMSPLTEFTDCEEVASMLVQLSDERAQTSFKGFGSLFHRAETDFEEKTATEKQKPAIADSPSASDPVIEDTRGEIHDLADKVRLLSAQFGGK